MDNKFDEQQTAEAHARPYWVPAGVDFDTLPEEMRAAIVGVINPAYQELVVQADEGLAQSTGITIVHLMWLEVLDQIQLGNEFNEFVDESNRPGSPGQREQMISRHLRLVGAKEKASRLLLRLYDFQEKWGPAGRYQDPLSAGARENAREEEH